MQKHDFYPWCGQLEKFYLFLFARLPMHLELLTNNHFKRWYHMLLDSQRIIEFPWVLSKLAPIRNRKKILDIGSPKLLALYLAKQYDVEIYATDLLDYFIDDFIQLKNILQTSNLKIECQDTTSLAYEDNFFDVVYSVSVIEHIPGQGDSVAISEIERVLKPSGKCLLTMPARNHYFEEYRKADDFYYGEKSESNKEEVFFQRYYTHEAITGRILEKTNLNLQRIIYVKEYPNKKIVKPFDFEGLPDSSYYFSTYHFSHLFKICRRLRIPFIPYLLCKRHISRFFEFTDNYLDDNLRMAFVELKKNGSM